MGFKEIIEARRNNFKKAEETVIVQDNKDITIGDDAVKDLILKQPDPLTIQDKLRALFSYEEKKDNPYPISARELHDFLGIGKDFSTWIKDMISKYDCIEDQDYKKCSPNLGNGSNGGQNKIEYYLTVDIAKEFAMVQKNDLGKLIRRYLIWAEEQLRKITDHAKEEKWAPQSTTQFDILRQMVLTFEEQQKQITEVKAVLTDQGERLQAVESSLLRKNISSSSVINRNISIGEMADILKDMGYKIGRNGLFSWLRENDFIIHYQKRCYKAKVEWENKGYFVTQKKKTETDNGHFETYTLEITPEGQEWLLRVYSLRSKK